MIIYACELFFSGALLVVLPFLEVQNEDCLYPWDCLRQKPAPCVDALNFHTLLLKRDENIFVVISEQSSQTHTQPIEDQRA